VRGAIARLVAERFKRRVEHLADESIGELLNFLPAAVVQIWQPFVQAVQFFSLRGF
jgi:hypothetical protein